MSKASLFNYKKCEYIFLETADLLVCLLNNGYCLYEDCLIQRNCIFKETNFSDNIYLIALWNLFGKLQATDQKELFSVKALNSGHVLQNPRVEVSGQQCPESGLRTPTRALNNVKSSNSLPRHIRQTEDKRHDSSTPGYAIQIFIKDIKNFIRDIKICNGYIC